jgi:glycine dehydrogenase
VTGLRTHPHPSPLPTTSPAAQGHLGDPHAFVDRHVGPRPDDVARMLSALGHESLEDLMAAALPGGVADTEEQRRDFAGQGTLPAPATESEALAELRELASANVVRQPMIGQGWYGTTTPAVIRRGVLENPAWYTAYTPYQPEISQGRLEALLNFQTVVADLTGLPIAGASLLDEATAAVEAMTLLRRANPRAKGVDALGVDPHLFATTRAVLQVRADALGIDLVEIDGNSMPAVPVFGLLLQNPDARGRVRDLRPLIGAAHAAGALVAVATDLLACAISPPPGEHGADVAIGSAQRLGVPLFGGGPHPAFIAVRADLARTLPGRLVGVSVDADGAPAYRLALQTREQHIRREKATSNICTAQVLLAVAASMYAVYHGADGLTGIATEIHAKAIALRRGLRSAGLEIADGAVFDTVSVKVADVSRVADAARERGIDIFVAGPDEVRVSIDETSSWDQVAALADAFGAQVSRSETGAGEDDLPVRTSTFLSHPTFSAHRSETQMLRYLRRLADFDYALDRGMIPLGSCTMKLNATAEMEPISWPNFAEVHPLAPADGTEGYRRLVRQLEQWLAELTGYAGVSVQPNAGSMGELAGLLAIRRYHADQGNDQRDVCLIPASAHGTNAASAVLAGLRVVVVRTDTDGTIDTGHMRALVAEHGERLAAIMITYPSTHGVYEHDVAEVCGLVHEAGGQVYIDGANLNALVGWARPGHFGGDVSHLNLHKTFCIPHGGGGPGVGPVAVAEHLVPYLPSRPDAPSRLGPVAGAPYGSAGILPIPWAYLRMMGPEGLARATAVAVLSANYLASRLGEHYPVLYTGKAGLVAHECILDIRPLTRDTGVTVDDIAKRLIDYGFHAPTMSFPVNGTLMVEPTESEDLVELDRFADAMIAIADEARRVKAGEWALADSPLRNAPHTAAALVGDWPYPYSRTEAVFPAGTTAAKYFPPVRRIDGAYGDRHLVCSCPSPEAFAEA